MQVNIESPHFRASKELQERIQAQFRRVEKLYPRITGCDVVLRKVNDDRGQNNEIEAHLLVPKSSFFIKQQAESFEIALDRIMDNLVQQLKREKERHESW
jgi:putative sigma-54 modulation protein